jgi:hypothetical protein
LKGRLGNQLFIYAFARCLAEKYEDHVVIYDRKDEEDSIWHSHLDGYKLHTSVGFSSDKKKFMQMDLYQKLLFVFDRFCIKALNPVQKKRFQEWKLKYYTQHGLLLCMDGVFNLPDRIPKSLYCDGYFQSAELFDCIRDKLLLELQPKEEHRQTEKDFIGQIESTNSVCLTIRLGDYINNTTHQVCTKKYYLDAMQKMRELHPDCIFFAFSDEVEKLKTILGDDGSIIYDSGTSKDYMSLDIMSKCKHFIISNSSFSWWAQYLSDNKDKVVIAPSKWYADAVPCDIMQDDWILLDC